MKNLNNFVLAMSVALSASGLANEIPDSKFYQVASLLQTSHYVGKTPENEKCEFTIKSSARFIHLLGVRHDEGKVYKTINVVLKDESSAEAWKYRSASDASGVIVQADRKIEEQSSEDYEVTHFVEIEASLNEDVEDFETFKRVRILEAFVDYTSDPSETLFECRSMKKIY
jgi:hypothetical protein